MKMSATLGLRSTVCSFLLTSGMAGSAYAGAPEAPAIDRAPSAGSPSWVETAEHATAEGGFNPLTLAPRLSLRTGLLTGFGGYDAARQAPIVESAAEAPIFGPVSLRLATAYSPDTDALRPALGGRILLLKQEKHELDGSASIFYRTEGFTEAEGEVELVASFGRSFGPTRVNLNLVFGQDPEGNERDGEVRLSSLSRVWAGIYAGIDGRCRVDLASEQRAAVGKGEASLDVLVGPIVTAMAGPLALFAQGGFSAVRYEGSPSASGMAVLAGAGTAL